MIKKIFIFSFSFLICFSIFSQEIDLVGSSGEEIKKEENLEEIKKDKKYSIGWNLGFNPILILNTSDVKQSAPSPIVYPFSLGVILPVKNFISIQPTLSVFTNYLLWNDDSAYPAEIENRTATAFNFLIDIPAVFNMTPAIKHFIGVGIGLSLLCRFAKLSNGVSSGDSGTSGTASDDVSEINKWFWKDLNFLFINTSFTYFFSFSEKIKAGPEVKFYLPCGSLISGRGMNNAMFSLGIKIRF